MFFEPNGLISIRELSFGTDLVLLKNDDEPKRRLNIWLDSSWWWLNMERTSVLGAASSDFGGDVSNFELTLSNLQASVTLKAPFVCIGICCCCCCWLDDESGSGGLRLESTKSAHSSSSSSLFFSSLSSWNSNKIINF